MHPIIQNAVAQAGTHMAMVIHTMFEGVAFRRDAFTFEVFSHEGDDLGTLTTADVNYAVHMLKRMGRPVGKLRNITMQTHPLYSNEPAFTFAWVDWMLDNNGNRF